MYADLIKGIIVVVGIAASAVIAIWGKVLEWSQNSLFPWLNENLPNIEQSIRDAFVQLDKAVVTIRQSAKMAWKKLREYLLKTAAHFERKSQSEWTRKITSFVIQKLDKAQPVIKKVETVEEINWDDLPADVRSEWMKTANQNIDIDVTKSRDDEINALTMTN
jgi:hypothetical protein